jgi:hypothetical protein
MSQGKLEADGVPDEQGFFQGLAQAPLHFHNAIAELVDNSIAAKDGKFKVIVDISDTASPGIYEASVIDDGPGISLDTIMNHVFKTGKKPLPGSSHLREHGFGLKNVLAKIEALKGEWEIWTRDKIAKKKGIFYYIKKPLQFKIPIDDSILPANYPENRLVNVGTVVKMRVPLSYLSTVAYGRRGGLPT